MAKREIPVCDGKIIVIVQDKYEAYDKPLPSGIDPAINWLGNFGLSEKDSGKKIKGKVPKYQIQTPDMVGKKLYFWSESSKKEVPGQKTVKKEKKNYRMGELDLGDPPIGWD
jgi:hypothetical protein